MSSCCRARHLSKTLLHEDLYLMELLVCRKEKTELPYRAQITLTVDIANQTVLDVRPLFPVTLTVMYLPF